jgi:hypothetical protein
MRIRRPSLVTCILLFLLCSGVAAAGTKYVVTSLRQISPSVVQQLQSRPPDLMASNFVTSLPRSTMTATATCPTGPHETRDEPIGGGYNSWRITGGQPGPAGDLEVESDGPAYWYGSLIGWQVTITNRSPSNIDSIGVYAVCEVP